MSFYIYPSEFYYKEKNDDAIYSFTPQGGLDVNRLIHNQAPWKKSGAAEIKKKIIVLASLFPLNQISKYQLESVVHDLRADGFEVFLHTKNHIFPLDNYEISSLASNYEINHVHRPKTNNEIEKDMTSALNISQPMMILDLQSLINNRFQPVINPDRVLKVSDLAHLNKSQRNNIYKLCKSNSPAIHKIICDTFSEQDNLIIHEINKNFPHTKIEVNYVRISINEEQLVQLVTEKKLSLAGVTLDLTRIKEDSSLLNIEVIGNLQNVENTQQNILEMIANADVGAVNVESMQFASGFYDRAEEQDVDLMGIEIVFGEISSTKLLPVNVAVEKEIIIRNPTHNPAEHLTRKPAGSDFKFKYKGKNTTLNQSMIIEKLSQYLILNNTNLEFVPKLQNGMCSALSQLFNEKSFAKWHALLSVIAQWDGKFENINDELKIYFNEILHVFKKIYVEGKENPSIYLGENLMTFIEHQGAAQASFQLNNPWHVISVKYSEEDRTWLLYEPNFIEGELKLQLHELPAAIEKSLGKLISVKNITTQIKPKIENIDKFLAEGGFLSVCQAFNADDMIKLMPRRHQYSKEGLNGLLLRNIGAYPAWMLGVTNKDSRIQSQAIHLLKQFALANPHTFADRLAKSICDISSFQQYACIEAILSIASRYPNDTVLQSTIQPIRYTIHKQNLETQFNSQLETWNKQVIEPKSTTKYCQEIVNGEKNKRLIELDSKQCVEAMSLALQQHCKHINRPFFYINSPEDLVCSAAYIERQGAIGVFKPGPGGALHDFLLEHADKSNPPVIIINYDNFEADDIVRFNSLLDNERQADGTAIPECAIVVGLNDPNKPDCYKGEDFYSRFGTNGVDQCHLKTEQLIPDMLPVLIKNEDNLLETYPINLCHAQNWKDKLLGQWVIKKDKLYFEEGLLAPALRSGKPIEIQNGIWNDPSFSYFWDQARILGYIPELGKELHITQPTFIRSEGYHWENLLNHAAFGNGLQPGGITVLNPTRLSDFFVRYQCDNESKQLETLPGIIKEHANKTLSINLTRSLNEDQWAELLMECQKYNVKINCHCAPGIKLPETFNFTIPPLEYNAPSTSGTVLAYGTNDIDMAILQAQQPGLKWKVIDISENTANDLLVNLDAKYNDKKINYEFTETYRVLKQAIDNNELIILKGNFTPELADGLAPYILQFNQKNPNKNGELWLVSSDVSNLNYVNLYSRHFSDEEKISLINSHLGLDNTPITYLYPGQTFSQTLSSIYFNMHIPHAAETYQDPWAGLWGLSGGVNLQPFDKNNSKSRADSFLKSREIAVNNILAYRPFVYLTGLTGVGKSTFVEKQLSTEHTTLYKGEKSMLAWACDKSDLRKILFIDEANITSREWSEFEGLFNNPPSIVIDGVFHQLSDQHKVVFAGNPLNYGGGRKMAPLFARHGNAVVFEPMPPEFIYESILKPVFSGTALEQDALAISEEILKVYQFVCNCSNDEVLISPRELQMIALLALSSYDKKRQNPIELARYYAYLIARPLTPATHLAEFDLNFFAALPGKTTGQIIPHSFQVTSSREPLYQKLTDFINLRDYRRSAKALDDSQRYGGLGGMVIEGEPGIGKSELVVAHLIAHGYKEATVENEKVSENAFYKMPVSMQLDEKKRLLMKAFNEGAVVIIDEINSAPMMERLLNDLLMGKSPDGKRPERPGFMVIGTQNPVTMAGRHKQSAPLARRLMTTHLPPYPPEEMMQILLARGIDNQVADAMVSSYMKQLLKAQTEHLAPAPTFRDLLNLADDYLKTNKKFAETFTPPEPVFVNQPLQPGIYKENKVPLFFSTEPKYSEKNMPEENKENIEQPINPVKS